MLYNSIMSTRVILINQQSVHGIFISQGLLIYFPSILHMGKGSGGGCCPKFKAPAPWWEILVYRFVERTLSSNLKELKESELSQFFSSPSTHHFSAVLEARGQAGDLGSSLKPKGKTQRQRDSSCSRGGEGRQWPCPGHCSCFFIVRAHLASVVHTLGPQCLSPGQHLFIAAGNSPQSKCTAFISLVWILLFKSTD